MILDHESISKGVIEDLDYLFGLRDRLVGGDDGAGVENDVLPLAIVVEVPVGDTKLVDVFGSIAEINACLNCGMAGNSGTAMNLVVIELEARGGIKALRP